MVTGSPVANFGTDGVAYGDNASNDGIYGSAYGSNTLGSLILPVNSGIHGRITQNALGGNNPGTVCIGAYGGIDAGADGEVNYGVDGDLSQIAVPDSGNTIPYYAIYGVAPHRAGTTTGSSINAGPNGNLSYAGYFEGDLFCANAYYYSDPKLKQNITAYTGALDQLSKVQIKKYTFKEQEFPKMNLPGGEQIGVLSTDLKAVFPNFVKTAKHPGGAKDDKAVDFEAVNYNALIPVLVQAVKELNAKPENQELAKTVAAQQQQIADQSKQLAELRSMLDDLCTNGCAGFIPKPNAQSAPVPNASLYQSIPNPASGSVSIGYSINMIYSSAYIRVVTMDGKSIAEYKITAQGTGSISFDTNAIAAGVYKYYLVIDDKIIDTKSMVITSK